MASPAQLQAYRAARITELKEQTLKLYTDIPNGPYKVCLQRVFDAFGTTIMEGITSSTLAAFLTGLKSDVHNGVQTDPQYRSAMRASQYGMFEAFGMVLDSLKEEAQRAGYVGPAGHANPIAAAVARGQHSPQGEAASSSSSDSGLQAGEIPLFAPLIIKQEEDLPRSQFDLGMMAAGPSQQQSRGRQIARHDSEEPDSTHTSPTRQARFLSFSAMRPAQPVNDEEDVDEYGDRLDGPKFRPTKVVASRAGSVPPTLFHMCDTCGSAFPSRQGLVRHEFTHRALRCEVCHKYVAEKKMAWHLKEIHGKSKRRSSVKKPAGFDEDSADSDVEASRRPTKPKKARQSFTTAFPARPPGPDEVQAADGSWPCAKCDVAYNSLSSLRKHSWTHDAEPCPYCTKRCAPYRLDLHIAEAHPDEKQTQSAARNKRALTVDRTITAESKGSFKCTFCPKVSDTFRGLKIHMAVHKHETPKKAKEVKPAAPVATSSAARPMKAVAEEVHVCPHCKATRNSMTAIKDHIKLFHNDMAIDKQ